MSAQCGREVKPQNKVQCVEIQVDWQYFTTYNTEMDK